VNNTDEYWTVDGVSLHQFGWSVRTLTGRLQAPPLRGDNGRAAYVPGEIWLPKLPDAYDLNLPMFLSGADPATGAPVDDARLQFNDSWAFLRNLFWTPEREFVLGRRWWRTGADGSTPGIAYAEARGQLTAGQPLAPTMTMRTHATFDVSVRLAHPFFYGPETTTPIARNAVVTVDNPGDWQAWARHLYIDLIGPLTRPRLTNTTPATDVYCGLSGVIASGETVTLDIKQFLAMSTKGGNRTGELYNSGTRPWMALLRGPNALTLTADSGTGHTALRFRAPYL
jgi:hypothetical protein